MTRPLAAVCLPRVQATYHAEALRVLVEFQHELVADFGEWEVARMFARHLWALLLEDER